MSHREGCWCDACTIRELRARLAEVTYERDGWRDADKAECELTAKLEARLADAERLLTLARNNGIDGGMGREIDAFLAAREGTP